LGWEGDPALRRLALLFATVPLMAVIGGPAATGKPVSDSSTVAGGVEAATQPPAAERAKLGTLDLTSATAPDSAFAALKTAAANGATLPVIVGLQVSFTPEGLLTIQQAQAQRAAIAAARTALVHALAAAPFAVNHTYNNAIPYVALSLSPAAVDALQASGLAATIQRDTPIPVALDTSTPIVEATEAAAVGRTGKGRTVAVLDTGVDKDHPFIGTSQVVDEACFSLGEDGIGDAGDCPNGSSNMTGTGAGEDCTYAPGCFHGTHVAGIAMGGPTSVVSFSGVARNAKLVSVQVFSKFTTSSACYPAAAPCAKTFTSDNLAGLNYVYNLPTTLRNNIAAVNMSLGGGVFTSACDSDSRKAAIDNLLSVGIATVIASGNDGSNTGVSAPGCISTAVTVGATDDADNVASFSNSSNLVDLLAPGVSIQSSMPNDDDRGRRRRSRS
jgi:subtilisin